MSTSFPLWCIIEQSSVISVPYSVINTSDTGINSSLRAQSISNSSPVRYASIPINRNFPIVLYSKLSHLIWSNCFLYSVSLSLCSQSTPYYSPLLKIIYLHIGKVKSKNICVCPIMMDKNIIAVKIITSPCRKNNFDRGFVFVKRVQKRCRFDAVTEIRT